MDYESSEMIIQYPQKMQDAGISQKIIDLEDTAWPHNGEKVDFPSSPDTYVTSFVLMKEDRAICHVGVRKSILYHRGEEYLAYGLSEVVTHPNYQNRGFASQTIKRARQFILSQHPDISVFTCAQERVSLYTKGGWTAMPGTCFVGGTIEKPFRSDSLKLVTMMLFVSSKSRQHREDFVNMDLVFELGEEKLW